MESDPRIFIYGILGVCVTANIGMMAYYHMHNKHQFSKNKTQFLTAIAKGDEKELIELYQKIKDSLVGFSNKRKAEGRSMLEQIASKLNLADRPELKRVTTEYIGPAESVARYGAKL